jgi:hypothetical protein
MQTENYLTTDVKNGITDLSSNPRLELKDIDGDTLDGRILFINSLGLESDNLRKAYDGVTYFGFSKTNVLNIF